jgi:phage shock protein A
LKNLDSIEKKVDMLMEYCDALKEQNELLLDDNEKLRKRFLDLSGELKELEEKHRILKLAKSVAVTNEKTLDIKTKINDFVREIDKCIAILSK